MNNEETGALKLSGPFLLCMAVTNMIHGFWWS
jgi:hypothetical protein